MLFIFFSKCYCFYYGELFQLALISLTYHHHCIFFFILKNLLSGTTRCFRLIVHSLCVSPRISHFSKDPWFLLLESGIRKQDLESLVCWLPSQLTEQGNVCVHTCLFLYVSISLYMKLNTSSYILNDSTLIRCYIDHSRLNMYVFTSYLIPTIHHPLIQLYTFSICVYWFQNCLPVSPWEIILSAQI